MKWHSGRLIQISEIANQIITNPPISSQNRTQSDWSYHTVIFLTFLEIKTKPKKEFSQKNHFNDTNCATL